jgi:hypothetical protein
MNLFELHKNPLAALLLAFMALVMLPGCSTTEEEPAATEEQSTKDMLCDEADAGTTECPDVK